jgi:carbon-monoxide dehydrogenase small subunit
MQVKQQFVVACSRPIVWDYFGQIEKVTLCMPGASLAEPVTGNHAKFLFNVKLGPISAAFVGEAELERDAESFHGVIRGGGRDSRGNSRAKGVLQYTLSEEMDKGATRVDIDAEFSLTGALAQFSRSNFVSDLAARITFDFAKNIEAALKAETVLKSNPSAKTEVPMRPASNLNVGSLFVSTIWTWIRALTGRIRSRGSTPSD